MNKFNRRANDWDKKRGDFFGFPRCCVEFYSKNCQIGWIDKYEEILPGIYGLLFADDNNGFIPCYKHAFQILNKRTSPKALIKNRKCKTPFPYGDKLPMSNTYIDAFGWNKIETMTRKTIELPDCRVSYSCDEETKNQVFERLLLFYTTLELFSGESLVQTDRGNIESPLVLGEIAADIFKFKVEYND